MSSPLRQSLTSSAVLVTAERCARELARCSAPCEAGWSRGAGFRPAHFALLVSETKAGREAAHARRSSPDSDGERAAHLIRQRGVAYLFAPGLRAPSDSAESTG